MAQATIAADLHQALDVHGNLTAKVTFNLEMMVDVVAQLTDVFLGQILDAHIGVDAGGGDDLVCGSTADAVDIRQGDFNAFLPGKVDTRDSCHGMNAPPTYLRLWCLTLGDSSNGLFEKLRKTHRFPARHQH